MKIFLFFFLSLATACGNGISHKEIPIQSQTAEPNLSLMMERSACLGNCPVYKLKVLQNGQVSFEGFSFSKSKGKIESNISQEKIEQVIAEIDRADFFSLSDNAGESGNCATDHPTVILSIKLRGKEKTTNHDLGCSGTADLEKLVGLENKIDEIVETKRWIGEQK